MSTRTLQIFKDHSRKNTDGFISKLGNIVTKSLDHNFLKWPSLYKLGKPSKNRWKRGHYSFNCSQLNHQEIWGQVGEEMLRITAILSPILQAA